MHIDMLRRGWPEAVLTGRYSFATRRRDGLVQGLFDAADVLTDGLIEKGRRDQLQLRIGGQPSMIVLTGAYPGYPPGIKICTISPAEPMLVLCERQVDRPPSISGAFEPVCFDVVDHRLGVVIGTLETTGGFVRPARTVIHGPSGQVLGRLTQPVTALIGRWLLVGRSRYDITVDGVRVARVRQIRRLWAYEYRVDLTAAGLLDPRLILACLLQKVHSLSGY
ncbi:hypothetical protein [Actinoplanes sp. NPDC049118]|uniref:hypothetical protein n=1 Tax=Actinoplanes sp. NPDC049118 TaxID=3155769 RepID=UPI0033FE72A7